MGEVGGARDRIGPTAAERHHRGLLRRSSRTGDPARRRIGRRQVLAAGGRLAHAGNARDRPAPAPLGELAPSRRRAVRRPHDLGYRRDRRPGRRRDARRARRTPSAPASRLLAHVGSDCSRDSSAMHDKSRRESIRSLCSIAARYAMFAPSFHATDTGPGRHPMADRMQVGWDLFAEHVDHDTAEAIFARSPHSRTRSAVVSSSSRPRSCTAMPNSKTSA